MIPWTCFIWLFLLTGSTLLFVSSQQFDNSQGRLSVGKPLPFLLGSDLEVSCHANACQRSSQVFLTVNGEGARLQRRDGCNFTFKLLRLGQPDSEVYCKLRQDGLTTVIAWIKLVGGLPPDPPTNVTCETTRGSPLVECRWWAGRHTHLPTSYNVTLRSGNTTSFWSADDGKVVLPRAALEAEPRYWLEVNAHNRLGQSRSETLAVSLTDIVIPQSPLITRIHFSNVSTPAAILQWDSPEDLSRLEASVRLRPHNFSSWEAKESTRLDRDQVQVGGLEPLTDYDFQIRACAAPVGNCSQWSAAASGRSPGKGPSQPLQAWRILGKRQSASLQDVTLLWKAPDPESYSGRVERYLVVLGRGPTAREVNCAASLSQCSLQVPSELPALAVSVVATYGTSPWTSVPLNFSDGAAPELLLALPAANSSAMLVSWEKTRSSTSRNEVLYYVLEWSSLPKRKNQLKWIKVAKENNNATVTGMTAGVRYNVTIYAVSRRGVSLPSSILAYSGQLKPSAGPSVSVLVHRPTRLLIEWEDPRVEQQRGFITNYSVYFSTLNVHSREITVVVPAGVGRQAWLECPEGGVAIQMSASTSAGEGPRGNPISSRPTESTAGLTTLVSTMLAAAAFTVQLACWRCVRRRIKERWTLLAPDWLVGKLPKPENSQAIKLLELVSECEPSFSSTSSDPPLSPISLVSDDNEDAYRPGPSFPHLLLMSDVLFPESDSDRGYKAQVAATLPPMEQTGWDRLDSTMVVVDSGSGQFSGNLLSSVELDSWSRHLDLDWSGDEWKEPGERETGVKASLGGGYFPQCFTPNNEQEA
ncbi:interleukin-23 receptor [Stigmatopora nigra]